MKQWLFVVSGMSFFVLCSAQPPEGDREQVGSDSNVPLLACERYSSGQFIADMRDHSADLVIAGFYLAGSGFPGVSQEVQWVANVIASALWIVDSGVRMVAKCRRRCRAQGVGSPGLQKIVVDP